MVRILDKRLQAALVVVLLLANLVALNVLLQPASARIDLTEDEEFTLSAHTREVLRGLPDELSIYGYFSQKTHKLLKPLIPEIRDLLEEYRVEGRGKVALTFADPKEDEEVEKEAHERFGVDPAAFEVRDQYEKGVTSAYFHLVIAYGDQYHKLDVNDLIEVSMPKDGELRVELANLEYQLTAGIARVTRAFGALESRVADEKEPIEVTAFLTQDPELQDEAGAPVVREFIDKKKKLFESAIEQLGRRFKKGLEAKLVDPTADAAARALAQRYRVRPTRTLEDPTPLYVGLVVRHGGQAEQVPLVGGGDRSPADLVRDVEAVIRRLLPGALKRVGLVTDKPEIPPQQLLQMQMAGQQPPSDEFETLRRALKQSYEVREVKLQAGRPAADVDVLVVLKPKGLSEKEAFALDQYLMYGYPVLVFVDQTEIDRQGTGREEIRLAPVESGLDALLAHYGVTVEKQLVQDVRCIPFIQPRMRSIGGGVMIQDYVEIPYPWFLDLREDGVSDQSLATRGLERLGMMWASPLALDPAKQPGATFTELLRSSDESWSSSELRNVMLGDEGVVKPDATARRPVAVAIQGKLGSFWKGKAPPSDKPEGDHEGEDGHDHEGEAEDGADGAGEEPGSLADAAKGKPPEAPVVPPLEETEEGTRLVIVGDADMVSDLAASRRGPLGGVFPENLRLVTNLLDWALLDEGLISIRSRGARQRPLEVLDKAEKQKVQRWNYAIPGALVVLFGVSRLGWRALGAGRRRRSAPGGAA